MPVPLLLTITVKPSVEEEEEPEIFTNTKTFEEVALGVMVADNPVTVVVAPEAIDDALKAVVKVPSTTCKIEPVGNWAGSNFANGFIEEVALIDLTLITQTPKR
jgi:hypothetical protein